MPKLYVRTWIGLVALVLGASGCAHHFGAHEHEVDFNGILVNGKTGLPMSGLEVEVRSDDDVVYRGETDGDGAIHFSHAFPCNQRNRMEDTPSKTLTVLFNVDAGDYGVLEIPVRLIHGSEVGSLGELRLIPKEGP